MKPERASTGAYARIRARRFTSASSILSIRETTRSRREKTVSTREEASRTSRIRSTRYSRAAPVFSISGKGHLGEVGVRRSQVRAGQAQDVADLRQGVVERLQVLDEGEQDHVAGPVEPEPSLGAPVRARSAPFPPRT